MNAQLVTQTPHCFNADRLAGDLFQFTPNLGNQGVKPSFPLTRGRYFPNIDSLAEQLTGTGLPLPVSFLKRLQKHKLPLADT
jgi:hypothetical protein